MHIRVPFFITDEKELASGITGMFASSQCRRPCNCCILDFFEDNISKLGPPRDLLLMRQVSYIHPLNINITNSDARKQTNIGATKILVTAPRTQSSILDCWFGCLQESVMSHACC